MFQGFLNSGLVEFFEENFIATSQQVFQACARHQIVDLCPLTPPKDTHCIGALHYEGHQTKTYGGIL